VSYRFVFNRLRKEVAFNEKNTFEISNRTNVIGMTRRSFLVTSTVITATLPILPSCAKQAKEIDSTALLYDTSSFRQRRRFRKRINISSLPITPPGSLSLENFIKHCTACHLCITHCPQQILKPAGFNYGFEYTFKPHLVFYEKGFCNYKCTVCSEVCPTSAIRKISTEEKKVIQIGIAELEENLCIVITENTSCGACSEHCPTQAVKMEPYIDGLTLPRVYPELCIGCGGCESICPVRPIKAIIIVANEIHQTAEKPPEGVMLEINREKLDFGF
jgi:ferredoxin